MGTRVKHGMIALFGCAFGFGASVTLQEASGPSIASALSPAGMVLRLTFPEAHARGHGRKGTRKKSPIDRRGEERLLQGHTRPEPSCRSSGRMTVPRRYGLSTGRRA